MTYAVPVLVLASSLALMWFCCIRPTRSRGAGGCCPPTQDRSAEIEALRREIAELRKSPE